MRRKNKLRSQLFVYSMPSIWSLHFRWSPKCHDSFIYCRHLMIAICALVFFFPSVSLTLIHAIGLLFANSSPAIHLRPSLAMSYSSTTKIHSYCITWLNDGSRVYWINLLKHGTLSGKSFMCACWDLSLHIMSNIDATSYNIAHFNCFLQSREHLGPLQLDFVHYPRIQVKEFNSTWIIRSKDPLWTISIAQIAHKAFYFHAFHPLLPFSSTIAYFDEVMIVIFSGKLNFPFLELLTDVRAGGAKRSNQSLIVAK